MSKTWMVPALALAFAVACGSKDDTADSGTTTGTGTGATGTGTGTGTGSEPTVISNFAPPGCGGGSEWVYRLELDGWSIRNFVNAFETGQPNVDYRWHEEAELDSVNANPTDMTETLEITLQDSAEFAQYTPQVNTIWRCGYHDDPANASNTYVARIWDLDDNFSDCGFGLDPNAPANAKADVKAGTAWSSDVNVDPSDDWQTQFNDPRCADWQFN